MSFSFGKAKKKVVEIFKFRTNGRTSKYMYNIFISRKMANNENNCGVIMDFLVSICPKKSFINAYEIFANAGCGRNAMCVCVRVWFLMTVVVHLSHL